MHLPQPKQAQYSHPGYILFCYIQPPPLGSTWGKVRGTPCMVYPLLPFGHFGFIILPLFGFTILCNVPFWFYHFVQYAILVLPVCAIGHFGFTSLVLHVYLFAILSYQYSIFMYVYTLFKTIFACSFSYW